MKVNQFCLWVASFCAGVNGCAGPFDPPVESTPIFAYPVDVDLDGEVEFRSVARLGGRIIPGTDIQDYTVGIFLLSSELSTPLKATSGRFPFKESEVVSSSSVVFGIPGANDLIMGGYYEQKVPGEAWTYFDVHQNDPQNYWKTLTEMLIGVRIAKDDGFHFGWIKFRRPNTTFTTPFEMVEFSWNPLPWEPIAAGRPPVIPLQPEITPEGLKVRWPAVLATWVLESSRSLGSDAEWVAVPEAANGEILLPLPETTRFYRLLGP